MKYALCFVWIDGYRGFNDFGVNLIDRYTFKLRINKLEKVEARLSYDSNKEYTGEFYGKNITISTIVGSNGTGKTSLLKFIMNLCNGSGTGDDEVDRFVAVYEKISKKGSFFETYYKGIDELSFNGFETTKIDDKNNCIQNSLPTEMEYIYLTNVYGQSGIQWHKMHDLSMGALLRQVENDNKDANIREYNRIKNELSNLLKKDGCNDEVTNLFDELYNLNNRQFASKEYEIQEDQKILNLISKKTDIAKYFDIQIPFVRAVLKYNYRWKENELLKEKEDILESFLPKTNINDVESFQNALSRAIFFSFLCSLIGSVVPESIITVNLRNKVIEIVTNEDFHSKTGIEKAIEFFLLLKRYFSELNTTYDLVENYLAFLQYAENNEIYSKGTHFATYQRDRSFTLGIEGSVESDVEDYAEWNNKYMRIVSMYDAIEYSIGLSSGERALLTIFARIFEIKERIESQNVILLLDEAEVALHPNWQRKFIQGILANIKNLLPGKSNYQIIIATHSPMILSDILSQNIVLLKKENSKVVVKEKKDQTFASSIYGLYNDTFYLDSPAGEFANRWLKKLLERIDNISDSEQEEEIKGNIELIGDSFLRSQFEKRYIKTLERKSDESRL